MNIKLLAIVFLCTLAISATSVLAASYTDTSTIQVGITSTLQIDIYPSTLNWGSLAPGAEGAFKNLTIENTGSVNVTNMYAYMDTLTVESGDPWRNANGQPYAVNFSAGGFLVMKNSTGGPGTYYYVGREVWNETQWIEGMTNEVTSLKAWGWYRNATAGQSDSTGRYLWELGNGTAGRCNETGSQFKIETGEDRPSSRQLDPAEEALYVTGNGQWGIFNMTGNGPLANQCIAAYYDCTKLYIYKWDYRSPFSSCDNKWYVQAHELYPGEKKYTTVEVWIPFGLPAGSTSNGVLTISVTGYT
jgi:hypothetical protein